MNKLLVVDDNQQNQYMAEVLLGNSGYRVELASNGSEALKQARKDPPDLVLADILMPVMDGFALCREWKLDDQLKSIPFIFYTATYTDAEDEQFALSLGADRFLVKPISTEVLVSTIGEVLNQSATNHSSFSEHLVPEDNVYLKKYNQTLINKLEDKVADLETANRRLENEIRERQRTEEEKRCLERQLIQSQKMEAIGTLAGGIAHDFNNILMVIMGLVDVASIRLHKGMSTETYLQEITKACNRAKDLVSQILTFSRKTEIKKGPVNVKSVVDEVLKMLRSSMPSTIEIRHSLESNSLIMASPTQIHQVLMNLVTNACQAIQTGEGMIEITLTDVEVDDSSHFGVLPGKYLKIEVSDTGVGMSEEQLEHIFDPYYTTKQKGEGTGLGLSVVHGIVAQSGGKIIARSEIKKGSTFSVFFPRIVSKIIAKTTDAELPKGGQEHIVLIDDESIQVETSTEFLKTLGYRVTAFQDSKRAFEYIKSNPQTVNLVVTDITMPGLPGDRLTQELQQSHPDIPVILCTGFNDRLSEQLAEEIGAKAFLMKPFDLRGLSITIRRVLDN
jgi:signal transduction histidine kinase